MGYSVYLGKYYLLVVFGLIGVIISGLFLLVQSSYFNLNPEIFSFAVTADMTLTIPLIYYFLIRKTKVKKITLVPVFILLMVITGYLLPEKHHSYLSFVEVYIFPLVELTAITFVFLNIRKVVLFYKKNNNKELDVIDALRMAAPNLERPIIFMAYEAAMFLYLVTPLRTSKINAGEIPFTYHKKSGIAAIIGGFVTLLIVETAAVHFLVSRWSDLTAWILSASSLYLILFLVAHYKASVRRAIIITDDYLYIKQGILGDIDIPITQIEKVEVTGKEIKTEGRLLDLTFFGSHNVFIKFKDEIEAIKMYGFKKKYKAVKLYIDEKILFQSTLQSKKLNNNLSAY